MGANPAPVSSPGAALRRPVIHAISRAISRADWVVSRADRVDGPTAAFADGSGAFSQARARAPRGPSGTLPPMDGRTDPSPEGEDAPGGPVRIVGVGGSAGALTAFQELLGALPADCGLALVVVSHSDPHQPSLLPEILGRATPLPVAEVEDGQTVEPGRVYVAPAGRGVTLRDGRLRVENRLPPGHPPLPIDQLFRSLAREQGGAATGIVLSGNGSDGTLGLGAIREAHGLALAQAPETAEFGAMPSSAIERDAVDWAAPVAELAQRLLVPRRARDVAPPPAEEPEEAGEPDVLRRIVSLVASRTGQRFAEYKRGTLLRRVERRMGLHDLDDLPDYLRHLEANPAEVDALWRDWLIGVSHFFRDAPAYEALAEAISRRISGKPDGAELRAWVAGCARGEEAYSIAIVLFEVLVSLGRRMDLKIFATDIDPAALEFARQGLYPDGIAADVGSERLRRHFDREDGHFRVKKRLRESIVFAVQNVLRDPPFVRMDLVSCRNLLIYLEPGAQHRVLGVLDYALEPGGLLLLGSSESASGFEDHLVPVDRRWRLFRREGSRTPPRAAVERWKGGLHTSGSAPAAGGGASTPDLSDLLRRQLAERYVPPAVLVDAQGHIEHVHGRTGPFLEPAPGRPSLSVIEMAREGLKAPLAAALREVAGDSKPGVERLAEVRGEDGVVPVRLGVRRAPDSRLSRPLFVVTFERQPAAQAGEAVGAPPERRDRAEQLEQELRSTRDDLQTTIEELQAANEEVRSVNEELQSTNEELETSKEETQSLNEELQTVNAELRSKVESLEDANDNLANLMDATEIACVFLDEDLSVKRFTREAQGLFRLREADVGRPLADFTTSLDDPDLIADAREVLRTLVPVQKDARTREGGWVTARLQPYRTRRNAIEGLVMTFVDVTRVKEAAGRAEVEARAFESIVDTVREPLLVLDGKLRVQRANDAFYRAFRVRREQTEGVLLYRLGRDQWDIPQLREFLGRILTENASFDDFVVEHDFPGIGTRTMRLNARRIAGREPGGDRILLAIEPEPAEPSSTGGAA